MSSDDPINSTHHGGDKYLIREFELPLTLVVGNDEFRVPDFLLPGRTQHLRLQS
jgi:hypothetical protein